MYTITQAARRADCAASAIRYYERIDLLPPARRGDNGYRYYDTADIERMVFVHRARELGFSIASITNMLRLADHPREPCEAGDALLADQLASVERRIRQLCELEARLQRLQDACDGKHAMQTCGILAALSDPRSDTAEPP